MKNNEEILCDELGYEFYTDAITLSRMLGMEDREYRYCVFHKNFEKFIIKSDITWGDEIFLYFNGTLEEFFKLFKAIM